MAELYVAGKSLHQISRLAEISVEAVRRRLLRAGVERRSSQAGLKLRQDAVKSDA
jgi:hypothetical protein